MTTLTPVKSSNIAAVGYDDAANELHVQFKSGTTYIYNGVTAQQHQALINAESIGSHYHHNIRNKFVSRKAT